MAIECVDTRALTLRVREAGTMRCAISTTDLDPASLVARVKAAPSIAETNWVAKVSTPEPYDVDAKVDLDRPRRRLRVTALDCGEKRGILRGLIGAGMDVHVVPWDTPAEKILATNPDGVFLSNGPGDPRELPEPAACAEQLLGRVPVFGICLGHQMICQAAGARTTTTAWSSTAWASSTRSSPVAPRSWTPGTPPTRMTCASGASAASRRSSAPRSSAASASRT